MTNPMLLLVSATLGTIASAPVPAVEPAVPNLSGKYSCVSDTRPCQSSTFSISQSGRKLEVKSEQGQIGDAEVTSPLSISLGHLGTRTASTCRP
jgi:hypothetical protein